MKCLVNDIIIFSLVVHAYYFSLLTKLYVSTVAAFAFKITSNKNSKQAPNIKTHNLFQQIKNEEKNNTQIERNN